MVVLYGNYLGSTLRETLPVLKNKHSKYWHIPSWFNILKNITHFYHCASVSIELINILYAYLTMKCSKFPLGNLYKNFFNIFEKRVLKNFNRMMHVFLNRLFWKVIFIADFLPQHEWLDCIPWFVRSPTGDWLWRRPMSTRFAAAAAGRRCRTCSSDPSNRESTGRTPLDCLRCQNYVEQ